MHRPARQTPFPFALHSVTRRASAAGFSLIEVTLAIGIIAFAFVALFGLLPTGMQTFRASVDATNDITMLQDMNAMVQVTGWSKLDKLDASSGDVYFFDEEGRRTDTKKDPSNDQAVKARRLYQVKLLVEKAYQPGVPSSSPNSKAEMKDARRVVVVIGDVFRPQSVKDFDAVTNSQDLAKNGKPRDVRSRTFIVSRMESEAGI